MVKMKSLKEEWLRGSSKKREKSNKTLDDYEKKENNKETDKED